MSNRSLARLAPLIILVALAVLSVVRPAPALGASFTVDATHDAVDASPGDGVCADATGACTLRAAVMETNALAGADEISLPAGAYVLSIPGAGEDASATGDLDVTQSLVVTGAGSDTTNVNAAMLDRVWNINADPLGDVVTVRLDGLKISGGAISYSGTGFQCEVSPDGGGICNGSGHLTLAESVVESNAAPAGGGIASYNGSLTLDSVEIRDNSADSGGGIYVNAGVATLRHVAIERNRTEHHGAGVDAIFTSIALTDSRVNANEAPLDGGGIRSLRAQLTIERSEINENMASIGGAIANQGSTADAQTPARLVITDSVVSQNIATRDFYPTGGGGALINEGVAELANVQVIGNSSGGEGGGILNQGTLAVTDTTISSNQSDLSGGGIYNEGTLTLTKSTLNDNSADSAGGGLINVGRDALPTVFGQAVVTNSTISGNSAAHTGGGIVNGGGMTLTNATIAFNSGNGLSGGFTASVGAQNTIIAHNSGGDCDTNFTVSPGHNLDSDGTCGLNGPSDISNTDPLLEPLANNGGPTETHALRAAECGIDSCTAGSPAIDAADNAACPTTDQRGVARPFDGDGDGNAVCDIGAHENDHGPIVCGCLPTSSASPGPTLGMPSPTSRLPTALPATGGDAGPPSAIPFALAGVAAVAGGALWRARRGARH